jgi:hypothetical protein
MSNIFPNEKCQKVIDNLVEKFSNSINDQETKFYKNKIDPFSAVIDSMICGISLSEWVSYEKMRQRQKTLQNSIGEFHQSIISTFDGWEDLRRGSIVDIKNSELKIVAEIKNKFNTTKGNHKIQIYKDLEKILAEDEYKGFTGYYVEIIPSQTGSKIIYNKPFVPPNNHTGSKVKERDDIKIIDGKSFYKIVTGHEDGLEQLYKTLPEMLRKALSINLAPENEDLFLQFFYKSFT